MSRPSSVRAVAARVIGEVAGRGKSLDRALAPALENFEDGRDRAFLQAICYGVLRFHPRLEFLLEQLLNRPLKARDIHLRALMLTGLYQISSMDVPAHAAVAESVAAAQEIGRPNAKGLVNAVLRRYIRERTNLDGLAMRSPEARWAHPEWLINRLAADWPDRWQSVLEENNRQPPMWLRVNRSRIAREDYLKRLEQLAIPGQYASESLCLDAPAPVGSLPGFSNGLVSVQDAGAQLAARFLDVRPGHRVLDACAAPGGKAAHILELCSDVDLDALDIDGGRLEMLESTFARLGLEARLIEGDAGRPEQWWDGRVYDRILVDAPCTATGVIRRHPDIKILRRESDVARLAQHQQEILDQMWPLLRPGGHLLYATCSILREENQSQAIAFLDRNADSEPVMLELARDLGLEAGPGRQILPGDAGMDGFYYACVRKLS
jgi:16S rRNA (cytosine967-C5)-methyltransferase